MSDPLHTATKTVSYNRGTVISLAVAAVVITTVAIFAFGCESKVPSLQVPTVKLSRAEYRAEELAAAADFDKRRVLLSLDAESLARELEAHGILVAAGYASLDQQDQLKASLLTLGMSTAAQVAAGTFNPMSLIPLAIGMLGTAYGVGKRYDNKRKDGVIVALKNGNGTTPTQPTPTPTVSK